MLLETNGFQISANTYLAFIHDYRYRKTWAYRSIAFGVMSILIALIIRAYITSHFEASAWFGVMAAILAIWFWVFLDYVFPLWGFYSARKKGFSADECHISINSEGIRSVDAQSDLKKPWSSIESIVRSRKHIFIYFNKCAAFMIPLTAFSSPDHAESFFSSAIEFQKAVKGYPTLLRFVLQFRADVPTSWLPTNCYVLCDKMQHRREKGLAFRDEASNVLKPRGIDYAAALDHSVSEP